MSSSIKSDIPSDNARNTAETVEYREEEESIDLTDKVRYNSLMIKCKEIKLSNQSWRFQIFVPDVYEVDFRLTENHLKGTIKFC